MNTPNRPRGFEDRLLREFRKYFDERNQTMTDAEKTPRRAPWFSRGGKLSLAGAVGAVALGVGAIVALPALTAGPAYAVEPNKDGTLRVEVNSPEDAAGLKAELAEYGVTSKVDFPPFGHMCEPGRYTPAPELDGTLTTEYGLADDGSHILVFEVDPKDYSPESGNVLVIQISEDLFSEEGSAMTESEMKGDKLVVQAVTVDSAEGEVGECNPRLIDVEVLDVDGGDGPGKGTSEQKDDGSKDEN